MGEDQDNPQHHISASEVVLLYLSRFLFLLFLLTEVPCLVRGKKI